MRYPDEATRTLGLKTHNEYGFEWYPKEKQHLRKRLADMSSHADFQSRKTKLQPLLEVVEESRNGISGSKIAGALAGVAFVFWVGNSVNAAVTDSCRDEWVAAENALRHLELNRDTLSCFDAVDKVFDFMECRGQGITDSSGVAIERQVLYNLCVDKFPGGGGTFWGSRYYWVPGKVGPKPADEQPEIAKCVVEE